MLAIGQHSQRSIGTADISQHCAVDSPFLRIATGMMAGAYVKAAAGFVADSGDPKLSADVQYTQTRRIWSTGNAVTTDTVSA